MHSGALALPPPVVRLLEALDAAGHQAFLVGSCVRTLLAGDVARDFEIVTSASADAVLALFATAVPVDPAQGRAMVPTAAGPVDVVPFARGASIDAELSHRAFTIHAIAVSPAGEVTDPFEGRADAGKALLRSVGPPAERLAEDPLRALRAARLVATEDLEIAPDLAAALPGVAPEIARVPTVRVRQELAALLLGASVSRGLALLRASGLEAVIAPGVRPDAAWVAGAVPADLELRLAAWLRGTRAVSVLRRLRFPRPRVVAVERLLQMHPIDGPGRAQPESRARRLARRSPAWLQGLVALREAEIEANDEGPEARERLAHLQASLRRATLEQARTRPALALDGGDVMQILGCGPGPHVGRALRHLAEGVAADPGSNDPETLRGRLLAWWRDAEPGRH